MLPGPVASIISQIIALILSGASFIGLCATPRGDIQIPTPFGAISIEAETAARLGVINAPLCQ